MKRLVYWVDDDADLLWAVKKHLAALAQRAELKPEVVVFDLPSRALTAAAQRPPDVLITDVRMPEMTGVELLEKMRASTTKLLVVVTTAYREDVAPERMNGDQNIVFVNKPYDVDEVLALAMRPLPPSFSGSLAVPQLADLIQMQDLARASGVLEIEYAGIVGSIHFRLGKIVHAQCAAAQGEPAFRAILAWPGGVFKNRPLPFPSPPDTIARATTELLMDALRLADEEAAQSSSPPAPNPNGDAKFADLVREAMTFEGVQACAVFDLGSSEVLACSEHGAAAAAAEGEVVRVARDVFLALGVREQMEEVAAWRVQGRELLLFFPQAPQRFFHAVLSLDANLALIRMQLQKILVCV